MSKALIFRAEIDIGSNLRLLLGDVHAAACGLQSKGRGPSMHPESSDGVIGRFSSIIIDKM
jgi:hypothetical protein